MQLPTDRYVTVEGLRLRYWLEGDSGPNLVLIHGIGGAVDVWRKQFEQLPQFHRVLAVDLPGCGRSAIPPQDPHNALQLLASSVRAVMQAVGMDQATIIGSSLGGAVAIEFAMRWPEMASSLVLISPAGMSHQVSWALRLMTIPRIGELLTLPDRTRTAHAIRSCVANPATVEEEDIDRAFAMATLPGAQDAFLRLLRTYASVRGLDRKELRRLQAGMRTIHAPTLVIWGERDQILPVSAAHVALEYLPNAALIIRKESGHLVFVEEPAWFAKLVSAFVRAPVQVLAQVRSDAPALAPPKPQEERKNARWFTPTQTSVARYLTPRTATIAGAGLLLFAGIRLMNQQRSMTTK